MSKKITLIINDSDFTILHSLYLEPIFNEYFDTVRYDADATYSKNSIVVTNCLNVDQWYKHLNCKIIVDNMWEEVIPTNISSHIWTNKNWFWYNESLWYNDLGYHNYIPKKTYKKTALMPMNMHCYHRELLFNALKPYLDQFIYSYASRGILLPDGGDPNSANWQRFFNRQWYDDTHFSIVAETRAIESGLFITEKTFKPIAFFHPFMILGQPTILSYLHSQGFETFNNIFDESYDTDDNIISRVTKIVDNVKSFRQVEYDNITRDKLEHNHNLFFNKKLVIDKIIKEIIEPTLEYAET
jgi:hypothetical protein